MVKYLDVKEDLKNGYHLADILTKTCFVEGYQDIYKLFCEKVIETQRKQSETIHNQAMNQLKADLTAFNITKHMKTYKTSKFLNIKRAIYRSITLFVSALGQLNGCFHNNVNFEILEDLHRKCVIDDNTLHDLSFAVAIACHIRLYQYMTNRTQQDIVANYSKDFFSLTASNRFLAVATKEEFVKFFSTVLRLQIVLNDDQINHINKYFCKNDVLPNVAANFFMGLYNEAIYEGEKRLFAQGIQSIQDLVLTDYVYYAYQAKGDINGGYDFINRSNQFFISNLTYFATGLSGLSCSKSGLYYYQLLKDIKKTYFIDYNCHAFERTVLDLNVSLLTINSTMSKGNLFEILKNLEKQFRLFESYIGHDKILTISGLNAWADKIIINKLLTRNGLYSFAGKIVLLWHLICPEKALHYSFELMEMLDLCPCNVVTIHLQHIVNHNVAKSYLSLGHVHQAKRYYKIAKNFKS